MTATITHPSLAPAAPSANDQLRAFRDGLVRFTSSQMTSMVKIGVLPEDSTIELLGGLLVYRDCGDSKGRPGMAGIAHDFSVRVIGKLDRWIDTDGRHVTTQTTLRLDNGYSPIPDAMILHGPPKNYRTRQPTAADVLCVIEVADTSYDRDAGEKLSAYAAAGLGQYVIINLPRRTAEVFTDPDSAASRYRHVETIGDTGSLSLVVAAGEIFLTPLTGLLP